MVKKILGGAAMVITFSMGSIAMAENEEASPDSASTGIGTSPKLSLSAEVKSRHTWRGSLTCSALNIQPTLNLTASNLTLGAWGCYTVDNSYAEVDLYAIYRKGAFSLAVLDYYSPNEAVKQNDFFQFNSKTTRHIVDVNASYSGTSSLPIRLMVGTMVYGDDRRDSAGTNRYSTYIEAGYTLKLSALQKIDFFVGGTPHKSLYGKQGGIVNVGFTAHQTVKILRQYDLPAYASIVINPMTENIYFILGITIL